MNQKEDKQCAGEQAEMIEIPYTRLREDVLRGIIEEFVLREGTDYGFQEFSLEQKTSQVKRQLEKGMARIVFNPADETCTIVPQKK